MVSLEDEKEFQKMPIWIKAFFFQVSFSLRACCLYFHFLFNVLCNFCLLKLAFLPSGIHYFSEIFSVDVMLY